MNTSQRATAASFRSFGQNLQNAILYEDADESICNAFAQLTDAERILILQELANVDETNS